MNEKSSFIIEDLDEFHLVIKADEEWRVRKELEAEILSLPFSPCRRADRVCYSSRKTLTVWMVRLETELCPTISC